MSSIEEISLKREGSSENVRNVIVNPANIEQVIVAITNQMYATLVPRYLLLASLVCDLALTSCRTYYL